MMNGIKEVLPIGRQLCQIYTRVMGYLRPVSMFNHGKKSEFYSRKYFRIDEASLMAEGQPKIQAMLESNRAFNAKYSTGN